MLTKEKVADIFKSIVRIFPGMPSYQEREGLRAQDKVIRHSIGIAPHRAGRTGWRNNG